MESFLFFLVAMGLMGIDQMKENKRKREIQRKREERRRNGECRFFWQ